MRRRCRSSCLSGTIIARRRARGANRFEELRYPYAEVVRLIGSTAVNLGEPTTPGFVTSDITGTMRRVWGADRCRCG